MKRLGKPDEWRGPSVLPRARNVQFPLRKRRHTWSAIRRRWPETETPFRPPSPTVITRANRRAPASLPQPERKERWVPLRYRSVRNVGRPSRHIEGRSRRPNAAWRTQHSAKAHVAKEHQQRERAEITQMSFPHLLGGEHGSTIWTRTVRT